jgi:hypothetical protein
MASADRSVSAAIYVNASGENVSVSDLRIEQHFAPRASSFTGQIQNLVNEYISTDPSRRVPFGGRRDELLALDEWLANPQLYRLLISAPAGRGKTALVIQWLEGLRNRSENTWEIAFIPISIRLSMNRPEVFYQALASRLGQILEAYIEAPSATPAESYYDQVARLLASPAAAKVPLLVVIDGLDEALDLNSLAGIFPVPPRRNLKVVLTARWIEDDSDAGGWLRRLTWDRGEAVTLVEPKLLNQDGIDEALTSLGRPGQTAAAISKLLQLSGGDPTLIRLYLEDIFGQKSAVSLTVEELEQIKPGFAGYFANWVKLQRQAWSTARKEGAAIDENRLMQVLAVFVCAYGPLEREELAEILRNTGFEVGFDMDGLLAPLGRFLMGAPSGVGRGYVLNPPVIGSYFRHEFFLLTQLEMIRQSFSRWSREIAVRLGGGHCSPRAVPAYVLQYAARHWQDTNAPVEDFLMLVSEGWLRAWEEFEHGYHGFARDVETVAAIAAAQHPPDRPWRAWQLRCSLVSSSLGSQGQRIPGELVLACAKSGKFTAMQILDWLESHSNRSRAQTLALVVPYLPQADRPATLAQGFEAADRVFDNWTRLWTVSTLAEQLPPDARLSAIRQALHPNRRTDPPGFWDNIEAVGVWISEVLPAYPQRRAVDVCKSPAAAVAALERCLTKTEFASVLGDLVERTRRNETPFDRLWILTAVARHLAEPARSKLTAELLTLLDSLDEDNRIWGTLALLPLLSGEERTARLSAAWSHARASTDTDAGIHLAVLARYLSGPERNAAVQDAATAMREAGDSDIWPWVALGVPMNKGDAAESFRECLRVVLGAPENAKSNTPALSMIARSLTPAERGPVLQEGIDAGRSVKDPLLKALLLAYLAPMLVEPERGVLQQQVLGLVQQLPATLDRSEVLAILAPDLPAGLLDEALLSVKKIADEYAICQLLLALARHLPEADRACLLQETLGVAARSADDGERSEVLMEVASQVPEAEELFQQALGAAQNIQDEVSRVKALFAIATRIQDQGRRATLLDEVVATAHRLLSRNTRAWTLMSVVCKLTGPERMTLLAEALGCARTLENPTDRAQVLNNLLRHVSPSEKPEVIREIYEASCGIEHLTNRAFALLYLARQLAEPVRGQCLQEALNVAALIPDAQSRVMTQAEIASDLPEAERTELLRLALQSARSIEDPGDRARALAQIAVASPQPNRAGRLNETLEAVEMVQDLGARARVMVDLASKFREPEWRIVHDQALQTLERIGEPSLRASLLVGLGGAAAETLALEAVRSIEGDSARINVVRRLASSSSPQVQEQAFEVLVSSGGRVSRPELLASISRFLPVLARLEGLPGIEEAHRAVTDASRWFL